MSFLDIFKSRCSLCGIKGGTKKIFHGSLYDMAYDYSVHYHLRCVEKILARPTYYGAKLTKAAASIAYDLKAISMRDGEPDPIEAKKRAEKAKEAMVTVGLL